LKISIIYVADDCMITQTVIEPIDMYE